MYTAAPSGEKWKRGYPLQFGPISGELRNKTVFHLVVILVAVVLGTVAFSLVDSQSVVDSFHYIIMAMTLIDAKNPNTLGGELVGVAVAIVSVGVILSFLPQVLGPTALSACRESHRAGKVSRMQNHVIVRGFSDTALALLNSVPKVQVLVLVKDKPSFDALAERRLPAIQGDYETLKVRRRTGVPESRATIAASPEDSENASIYLTSKKLARPFRVFATVSSQENLEKLKEVKADHIISPGS